jgi:hypothetical protein
MFAVCRVNCRKEGEVSSCNYPTPGARDGVTSKVAERGMRRSKLLIDCGRGRSTGRSNAVSGFSDMGWEKILSVSSESNGQYEVTVNDT